MNYQTEVSELSLIALVLVTAAALRGTVSDQTARTASETFDVDGEFDVVDAKTPFEEVTAGTEQ